ncbi:MAG: chemotaxis response regulator protein-glutamate methylesterase [Myxococcales bacterium]|nr:chemotaxis response regulator protein-glutamate methylesterase [Myxococcales bacterium]
MSRIRVLVIDDSALVRKLLTEILSKYPDIEVVGHARDPLVARDRIKDLAPDVLTLDVEMPRMDGLTFLSNLMRLRPMPVVMVSSLTERGGDVTLRALELGAFDYVTKPKIDLAFRLEDYADELAEKIRAAHEARNKVAARDAEASVPRLPSLERRFETTDRLLAIGASTGGTEAIREILTALPPDCPAVVIVQHIPEMFSTLFAQRLDQVCRLSVCEARDGQPIVPGHAYVAPGNRHLRVTRSGARYEARVTEDERVNRHRPSVDVLFESLAEHAPRNTVAALLTGMGSDGAKGLLSLRTAGAATIAQDEATSVIYGMPREAAKLGAAEEILPLPSIARRMLERAWGRA